MGSFKKFLMEEDETLQQIYAILEELSEEEIDEFGFVLYYEFFDDEDTDEDDYDFFELDDIKEMINSLGPEFYDEILYLLEEDDEDDDLEEGVSRAMKAKNMNRKKRKFMVKSKAIMKRTKVKRKQLARKDKAKRKRYYRANKKKLASYQRSRAKAIKKGKHFSKLRRSA